MLFLLDQSLECVDMLCKSGLALLRGLVAGVWLFSDELLFHDDIIFSLQRLGMARKIAVGCAEQFLKRREIRRIVDYQHRHDAEPDPVIKGLVDILDDVFQNCG
jgi:hypothetical protein